MLANMLLMFSLKKELTKGRHKEVDEAKVNLGSARVANNDAHVAIGIAAGYVNLTASLLGLETGCCSCIMGYEELKKMMHLDSDPVLLMGVGYKNKNINRRVHSLDGTEEHRKNGWESKLPTLKKESIKINYIR